jgi:hypothetical protein
MSRIRQQTSVQGGRAAGGAPARPGQRWRGAHGAAAARAAVEPPGLRRGGPSPAASACDLSRPPWRRRRQQPEAVSRPVEAALSSSPRGRARPPRRRAAPAPRAPAQYPAPRRPLAKPAAQPVRRATSTAPGEAGARTRCSACASSGQLRKVARPYASAPSRYDANAAAHSRGSCRVARPRRSAPDRAGPAREQQDPRASRAAHQEDHQAPQGRVVEPQRAQPGGGSHDSTAEDAHDAQHALLSRCSWPRPARARPHKRLLRKHTGFWLSYSGAT